MANKATPEQTLKTIQLVAAAVILLEALVLVGFAGFGLFTDILAGQAKSLPAAIFEVALYAGAGTWLFFVFRGLQKSQRWSRNAAIFWQTCQLAVASQSFTGRGANAFIGVALVMSSVSVMALLLSKPVLAANRKEISGE
jgi:hypothetical protein